MCEYCKYCHPFLAQSHFIKQDRDSAVISDLRVEYDCCEEKYQLQNTIIFRPRKNIKYNIQNKIFIDYCPWCGRKLNSHEIDFSTLNR